MADIDERDQVGYAIAADTSAHTGKFYGLTTCTAVVVSAITHDSQWVAGDGDLTDLTAIPIGTFVPCQFTSITLTSGEAILHRQ